MFLATLVLAQPSLLANLAAGSSEPHGFVVAGRWAWFVADGAVWRTDGTAKGTDFLAVARPGDRVWAIGDAVVYGAGDGLHVSRGVVDEVVRPAPLLVVKGEAGVFVVEHAPDEKLVRLVHFDGKHWAQLSEEPSPEPLGSPWGNMVGSTFVGGVGAQFWVSRGAPESTKTISGIPDAGWTSCTAAGARVFCSGSAGASVLERDSGRVLGRLETRDPQVVAVPPGNSVLLLHNDPGLGFSRLHLFRGDSTELVAFNPWDEVQGENWIDIVSITQHRGRSWFLADHDAGRAIFVTDGTAAGTRLFDRAAGVSWMGVVDGRLLIANEGEFREVLVDSKPLCIEPLQKDCSAKSPTKPFLSVAPAANPREAVRFGDKLLFAAEWPEGSEPSLAPFPAGCSAVSGPPILLASLLFVSRRRRR